MLGGRRRLRLHPADRHPDIDSYQRLVDHLLEAKVGLARYFTYIVTKPVKMSAPPLERLLELAGPE